MSVAFRPRSPLRKPVESFRALFGDDYYICRFQEVWKERVVNYWDLMGPKVSSNTPRNMTDMKTNLSSFAAALKDKVVWVMNVVPEDVLPSF